MPSSCNVKVVCRFRPVNEIERKRAESEKKGINNNNNNNNDDNHAVKVTKDVFVRVFDKHSGKNLDFTFDRVFFSSKKERNDDNINNNKKNGSSQFDVYVYTAKETVDDVLEGYNGTIFAYGQTGSGKTYTMFGKEGLDYSNFTLNQPAASASASASGSKECNCASKSCGSCGGADSVFEGAGIIPRSVSHMFSRIRNDVEGTEFSIKCSFLEIYREIVKDLLNPRKTGSNLKVRETPSKGVWVDGLTEHYVTSEREVLKLIHFGEKFRSTFATNMNLVSSRSHSLFVVTLHQKSPDGSTKTGKLNLADLAGSEKVGKTGAVGQRLEEAKKINQSLSALGNCINALSKGKRKRGHVPYRDSRLTFILRESLGGNCKTTLIIACSPHSYNLEETVSTLKFGQRAKNIRNTVRINKQRSIEELNSIIKQLTSELNSLKKYVRYLEMKVPDLHLVRVEYESFQRDGDEKRSERRGSTSESVGVGTQQDTRDGPFDESESDTEDASCSESVPEDEEEMRCLPGVVRERSVTKTLTMIEARVELEKVRENANARVKEVEEEMKGYVDECTSLTEDVKEIGDLLEVEKRDRMNESKEFKEREQDFNRRIEVMEREEMRLKNEVSLFRDQVNDLHDRNSDLEVQVTEMSGSLHEATTRGDDLSKQLTSRVKNLTKAANDLEQREKDLVIARERANKSSKESSLLAQDLLYLKMESSRYKESIDALKKEVENLTGLALKADGDLENVKDERDELLSQYLEATTMITNINEKLEEKSNQLNRANEIIAEFKFTPQEINKRRRKLMDEIASSRTRVEKVEGMYDEVVGKVGVLKNEVVGYKKVIARDKMMLESSRMENVSMKTKLEREMEKSREREEEATRLNLQVGEMGRDHEMKINEMEEGKSRLEGNISQVKEELMESENQCSEYEEEIKRLKEEMKEMKDELNKKKRDGFKLGEDLKMTLNAVVEKDIKVSELVEQVNSSQETIESLSDQVVRTVCEYNEFKEQLKIDEERKKFASELSEHQKIVRIVSNQSPVKMFLNYLSPSKATLKKDDIEQIGSRDKDGWLYKLGGVMVKTWSKKWFTLIGCSLYYYKDDKSDIPKGAILLDGCRLEGVSGSTRRDLSFGIYHPSRTPIYLACETQKEFDEWVIALNDNIRITDRRLTQDFLSTEFFSSASGTTSMRPTSAPNSSNFT